MMIILFLLSSIANAAELNVPVSTVYLNAQTSIVSAMCGDQSAFRRCKVPDANACKTMADQAFTACYQKDLATRKTTDVSATEARNLSQSLLDCASKAPAFVASDALQSACYSKAVRTNEKLQIDVSYLKSYQPADVPKSVTVPQAKAEVHIDLATRYVLYMKQATEGAQQLRTALKTNSKSVCPSYRGRDHAGCALEAFKKVPARSSAELTLQLAVLVAEVVHDKQELGQARATQLLLTNSAAYLETINFANWWLLTEPAVYEYDEMQRRDLVKTENQVLGQLKTKMSALFEKNFEDVARQPANASSKASLQQLKTRVRSALQRPWVLR